MSNAKQVSPRTPTTIMIAVKDLAIAPENPRFAEEPDAELEGMGQTILAAGNLDAILVRPASEDELPNGGYMILAGRRRFLAVMNQIASGNATAEFFLKAEIITDKKSQAAALLLTNTERKMMHAADVIIAIGKMRKTRMSLKQISGAIGYDELEVKRLSALSDLPPEILNALKSDKIQLADARRLARIKDKAAHEEAAELIARGDRLWEFWSKHEPSRAEKLAVSDGRVAFVGLKTYRAHDGRTESDLFGDVEEQILDVPLLDQLWLEKANAIAALISTDKTQVIAQLSSNYYPASSSLIQLESWRNARKSSSPDRTERLTQLRDKMADVQVDELSIAQLSEHYTDLIELDRLIYVEDDIRIIVLHHGYRSNIPSYMAFAVAVPSEHQERGPTSYDNRPSRISNITTPPIKVATEGRSHALHDRLSDYGTRGLARALADDPVASFTVAIAQMFTSQMLSFYGQGASTISAKHYEMTKEGPTQALDGEVRARLHTRVVNYEQSGLRPIGWVDSLGHGDKMALLAELTAMSLNLREARTTSINHEARAQAAEISEMISYDITSYWTPDEPFLRGHSRNQLLEMVEQMGLMPEDPSIKAMKKGELIQLVADTAAELNWAPKTLEWTTGSEDEDIAEAQSEDDNELMTDAEAA